MIASASTAASRWSGPRWAWLFGSVAALALCWWWLWTQRSYWNPLFFAGLWTAATVLIRSFAGQKPLPLRRHLGLMALSAPLWWWFEFVNEFVQNWRYHGAGQYNAVEYQVFATLAFSTVAPALDAAWTAATRFLPQGVDEGLQRGDRPDALTRASAWWVIAAGCLAQASVLLWPQSTYALVWVAPFLVFDGLVSLRGGVSLLVLLRERQWRLPLAVALGGLACGFLWELWNFYAMPKWTYDVPLMNFWHVFEMPLLGYLGYVPFAWSAHQIIAFAEGLLRRSRS